MVFTFGTSLNVDECKFLTISGASSRPHVYHLFNGSKRDPCSSHKCFGVPINDTIAWSLHIQQTILEPNHSLHFLKRDLIFTPPHPRLLSFRSFVRPTLECASSVRDRHQSYLVHNIETGPWRAPRFLFSDY